MSEWNLLQISVRKMSDKFPINKFLKQEDSLSPLLFKFALEYAFGKFQVNQNGLKVNGTNQILVNAKMLI